MTLSENDRQELIKYRIDRAKNTIEDIQFLIENNKLSIAVNRIYYGIFYILSALALKYQFSTSKHQELIGWFNKMFVKENLVDRKYGQVVYKAFDKRSKGDYDDFVEFNKQEVTELFEEMKEFIKKIEEIIGLN